jgi:hypothetical protein
MPRYLYVASITSAAGNQTFYIDADSREEADIRAAQHDTDGMYAEEIEVQDLSRLEACGETTTDDFGDFPSTKEGHEDQ